MHTSHQDNFICHFNKMYNSDNLCLKWNGFEDVLKSAFVDLRNDREFTDMALACGKEPLLFWDLHAYRMDWLVIVSKYDLPSLVSNCKFLTKANPPSSQKTKVKVI